MKLASSHTYPIPKDAQYKQHGPKGELPLRKMRIGDSFLLRRKSTRKFNTISAFSKNTTMRFYIMKVGNGYRIWRIF